jgi:hypothetical protein
MGLQQVSSCTHSHVLHPLCPNFSTSAKAAYLGLVILGGAAVCYALKNWVAAKSVTVEKAFDNEKYSQLQHKLEAKKGEKKINVFVVEALKHAKEAFDEHKVPKITFKNLEPLNQNIAYFAELLDEQVLSEPQNWRDDAAHAYKTMEIAYALALQAFEELAQSETTKSRAYCMQVILDCLSLYHVIRTDGKMTLQKSGCRTYNCPSTINTDYSSTFYADGNLQNKATRLYDRILFEMGRVYNINMPDNWPKFQYDWDMESYKCPLPTEHSGSTTSLPSDLITPEMTLVLNNLLGGMRTTKTLSTYRKGFPLTVEKMHDWVMKGIQDGRPFIAVKMRSIYDYSEDIVFLTHADNKPNDWMQKLLDRRDTNSGPCFLTIPNKQSFFADLHPQTLEEFNTTMKNGYGRALHTEWEIIGHPNKRKTAKTAKMEEDGICIEVRTILDDLLVNALRCARCVDEMPVLTSLPISTDEVAHPIMKFKGIQGSPVAGIVLKLKFVPEAVYPPQPIVRLLILVQKDSDNPRQWSQQPIQGGMQPEFFKAFTNAQGELTETEFSKLKQLLWKPIRDTKGNLWQLVT